MSAVAKRYARALFEVAKERGNIDAIEVDLKGIVDAVQTSAELTAFLTHPQVTVEAKKELLTSVFEGKIATESLHFLLVLIDNERDSDLAGIYSYFVTMANDERGIADAIVTTAKPLTTEEQAELARKFGASIGKTLRVETVVDPSIMGGVVVQIGDRLYDGSIKSKLEHFAHQL